MSPERGGVGPKYLTLLPTQSQRALFLSLRFRPFFGNPIGQLTQADLSLASVALDRFASSFAGDVSQRRLWDATRGFGVDVRSSEDALQRSYPNTERCFKQW